MKKIMLVLFAFGSVTVTRSADTRHNKAGHYNAEHQ